jgi:hypothetical protein
VPIVKSLIELHGGTFSLKSKLREGTEVVVTFPPERVMAALEPIVEPNVPTILAPPPIVPEPADRPGAFGGFLASISFGRVRRKRSAKSAMTAAMLLAALWLMPTDAADRAGLIAVGSSPNWYAFAVPATRTVALGV